MIRLYYQQHGDALFVVIDPYWHSTAAVDNRLDGRGGVEMADLYEWGGKGKNGVWEFERQRPGWELPIHQLMAKNGVTIFFHGHDHIFVQQERDGVIYQELPEPADPAYTASNENAYKTGVKLPNSGHVRVTVSAAEVNVDYTNCHLIDHKLS